MHANHGALLLMSSCSHQTQRNNQGARQQSRLLELQSHLERLTRENMTLEAKIGELSQYQNEVVALRSEIAKLQVNCALN